MTKIKTLFAGAAIASISLFPALAQGETSVSAEITNAETGSSIPAASVIVVAGSGSDTITAAVADGSGRITVTGLAPGAYTFVFSAADYEVAETPVLISPVNDIYDLGNIALTPQDATAVLDQVTVIGEATRDIQITPGANVFSIADNAIARAGSTLDAMKSLPGITLDSDGTVLLRGSDRVTILIDGKPSGLTGIGNQSGLDSIPAANIARIEIINNPSARFGAAGSAGVINLVMQSGASDGWSGDIGLKYGVGTLQKARPDLPSDLGSFSRTPKLTPSFTLSHGGNRTDIRLQGEILFQDKVANNEFTSRFYDDGRIIDSQVAENRKQTHYILKAGIDHRFDARNTFSLSSVYDFEHHKDRSDVPFIDRATGQTNRLWFWTEKEDTGHFSITGNYTHAFDAPGHEVSARIEYIRGWEDEAYDLNELSPVRPGGFGTDAFHLVAKENTVPISLDYTRPLRNGRLELGSKLQFRWIPITYDTTPGAGSIIYPGLGDTSDWQENIYSLYGNYMRETEHTVVEAGLRAEQTDVEYTLADDNIYYPNSDSYDYFRLFLNVRLTYKLGNSTDISAFYNSRVDRPGEPELRIFPKYDDPELLKVGNPYLRPQFTQTYELSAKRAWDDTTLSAALYYRDIEDAFQRIYAIDPTNTNYDIINKIYQNTGQATNTGIELIATHKQGDWMSLSSSVNIYEIERDAAVVNLLFPVPRTLLLEASSDTTWNAKLSAELVGPVDIKLQLTGVYYAAHDIPQGRELARSSFDIGVVKPLFDDRAELSLVASDVFNDFGLQQEYEGNGFTALYENYYETQVITAGLKYKF